ncbi:MAG: hypothetical protein B0W54_04920 [Cellvibrio sp. 79]|nr:MAG: hypothetical protein B0W54_04920 [Cellvibrio sp. 79]
MNEILHAHKFLSGGGEMGQLIREYDWDNSPLGNPVEWAQALKTTIRLMLSSAHPMFIWWGPDLIQFYNDAYRQSIGSERHPHALGQYGEECWEEIWPVIGPQIEQVMQGEGSVWQENHLVPITRNGRLDDVYWTYTYDPIYDAEAPNEIGGVLVIVTETTEYIQLQQKQAHDEARWRDLFKKSPSFMCTLTGPEHVFEHVNPRYLELVSNRDVLNKTLKDALPEVYAQGFGDLLDEVYETGQTYTGTAVPISLRNHNEEEKTLYLDFVYQPIRDSSGKITGIFVNGSDVTARILSEQRLEEQDRRKDEFLAMLAHELRNPLAPIRNASELLLHVSEAGSTTHALGELIRRQLKQLTRLIDDLLEVSRISQGLLQLQMENVVIDQAIKFAIESTGNTIPEKKLLITYDCTEPDLIVNGDFARLSQSLINIIVNAMKYTEEGGKIDITLKRENHEAVVDIRDNGIGMEPAMLDKVFDLFVQVDHSIDRSRGGLGIGLSIVKTIIGMHGGSVTAASSGLGLGSTFSVRLPLAQLTLSTNETTDKKILPALKILIVDDNIDAANSLAMLLQYVGHQTATVYRGTDALDLLKHQIFDVILLDIGLPDIDGYQVAESIRADNARQIIIAVSGYGQAEDINKAKASGFTDHLTKPVSFDDLERKLSELQHVN